MPFSSQIIKYDSLVDSNLIQYDVIHEFIINAGFEQFRIESIPGDASKRLYYRVYTLTKSLILMDASADIGSMQPFLNVDNLLLTTGIRAPIVIASDVSKGLLLLEDLGGWSFTRYLVKSPEKEMELYTSAVDVLLRFHSIGDSLQLPKQSVFILKQGIETFLDWYVKNKISVAIYKQVSDELYEIFDRLFPLLSNIRHGFVHGDFMADNLLVIEGLKGVEQVGVIDFQDAVLGSPAYDLVSLLEDARRDVDSDVVMKMKNRFISNIPELNKQNFENSYAILSAQRNLRIIGVFNRLNIRDGKPKYLGYLPRVWGYVMETLEHPLMFELKKWFIKYDLFEKQ